MVPYDSNLKELIKKRFDFLDLIPTLMSVVDIEAKALICCSGKLSEILKIEEDRIYELSKIIKSSDTPYQDIIKSKKAISFFVFATALDNTLVPLMTNSVIYEIEGKQFLLSSHINTTDNILSKNIKIENNSNILENIFATMPAFTCVLSFNKKEIVFSNDFCNRFFGIDVAGRNTEDFFVEMEELEQLDKNTLFNTQFNTIIGSKWFRISACYINWKNEKGILLLGKDISKVRKLEDTLLRKATIDELTKIYNRQAGINFINDYLNDCAKENKIFTVAYIKVNGVNEIQNKHGLVEGDKYIIEIVSLIRSVIRQSDVFSRLKYNELIVLFPNCVATVVENILKTLVNKIVTLNNEQPLYKFSINFSILEINNENISDVDNIIRTLSNNFDFEMEI